jgi:ABC-type lipopolysaccharide export system ATPase subunit
MSDEAKRAEVERLIAVLGLAKAKDTRVGGARARGLSGGERKRLSVGCELVRSPMLVFLDVSAPSAAAVAASARVDGKDQRGSRMA